ncbi:MAG: hypothetical protein HC855_11280 [Rhizobiales bacterium]|nr:hypothetical protein [Hyphomicrobiales bacterium]
MRLRISATVQDLPVPVVPENREMLAQHLVDFDHCRDGWVLLDVAHADRGFGIAGVSLAKLFTACPVNQIAERGIAGDAAPESLRFAVGIFR